MEKKKVEFNGIAEEAGKGMKSLFGKAKEGLVKVVDQNADGSFDKEDVAAITDAVSTAAKNTAVAVKDSLVEQKREYDRKTLQPIFVEDINDVYFYYPKLIRLTTMDKKRAESEVCQGSIGYLSVHNDLTVMNIYHDKLDAFGITLIPDAESKVYYIDPMDREKYIAIEDYFGHLRIARVQELENIAKDLGAKYFKITYKEHRAEVTSNQALAKGVLGFGKAKETSSVEHVAKVNEVSTIGIAAENRFKEGHVPVVPTLNYLKNDPVVQGLIDLRMNSSLESRKYEISLSKTLGIKEADAVKIDGALKAMKMSSNISIANEVRNESRRFLEYEIEFE